MDAIKEAFMRIKEDIDKLRIEIEVIRSEIKSIKSQKTQNIKTINSEDKIKNDQQIQYINNSKEIVNKKIPEIHVNRQTKEGIQQSYPSIYEAKKDKYPTDKVNIIEKNEQKTDIQTDCNKILDNKSEVKRQKMDKYSFSIGNGGVQTNSQVYSQTGIQAGDMVEKQLILSEKEKYQHLYNKNNESITLSEFERANKILDTLDEIKQGIRQKFKALTSQEMHIFSIIYNLEEEGIEQITYPIIAQKAQLTESSIREYTNKLIKKGIPIQKTKINNKKIVLKIHQDLKKVASLGTIIALRDL